MATADALEYLPFQAEVRLLAGKLTMLAVEPAAGALYAVQVAEIRAWQATRPKR